MADLTDTPPVPLNTNPRFQHQEVIILGCRGLDVPRHRAHDDFLMSSSSRRIAGQS